MQKLLPEILSGLWSKGKEFLDLLTGKLRTFAAVADTSRKGALPDFTAALTMGELHPLLPAAGAIHVLGFDLCFVQF